MLFAIKDTCSGEVLVDKIPREEIVPLFKTYEEFFGWGTVCIVREESKPRHWEKSWEREYKEEYIALFEELQILGNL